MKEYLENAAQLGIYAAQHDNWMEPCFDDITKADDYGEFENQHRRGWEETNHFEYYYDRKLQDWSIEAAMLDGVDKLKNWEGWYHGYYDPLKEEFWEAWEEEVGLYEKWEEAQKKLRTK